MRVNNIPEPALTGYEVSQYPGLGLAPSVANLARCYAKLRFPFRNRLHQKESSCPDLLL